MPIQTSLSVAPKLPVSLRSDENCENSGKQAHPRIGCMLTNVTLHTWWKVQNLQSDILCCHEWVLDLFGWQWQSYVWSLSSSANGPLVLILVQWEIRSEMKIHSAMREKFLIIFHILIIEENGQHLHDVFFYRHKIPQNKLWQFSILSNFFSDCFPLKWFLFGIPQDD